MIHVGKIKLRASRQIQLKYNGKKDQKAPIPQPPIKSQTLVLKESRKVEIVCKVHLFIPSATRHKSSLCGRLHRTHIGGTRSLAGQLQRAEGRGWDAQRAGPGSSRWSPWRRQRWRRSCSWCGTCIKQKCFAWKILASLRPVRKLPTNPYRWIFIECHWWFGVC